MGFRAISRDDLPGRGAVLRHRASKHVVVVDHFYTDKSQIRVKRLDGAYEDLTDGEVTDLYEQATAPDDKALRTKHWPDFVINLP